MRNALFVILLLITLRLPAQTLTPEESSVISPFSEQLAKEYFDRQSCDDLEGIWEFSKEQMTLAIMRNEDPLTSPQYAYRILVIESVDMLVEPGTILGYIEQITPRKMTMRLYALRGEDSLSLPMNCNADVSDNQSTIDITPVNVKIMLRINLMRLLPSIFGGLTVTAEPNMPAAKVGMRKIYPTAYNSNLQSIRYL